MIERARAAMGRRPFIGITLSVLVHALLMLALFWVPPGRSSVQKRGDALIVELPDLQGESGRGTPGPAAGETPVPAEPAPKTPPSRPAPPARPTPPAPRAPAVARPAPPSAEPRETSRAVATVQ